MKLSDYAKVLIVRITVNGLPGISRTDSAETDTLTKSKGTTRRHARVTKTLFAESARATEMRKIAGAVRGWIRYASLPGEIDGKYMIPASKFEEIGKKLNDFKDNYNKLVREFAENLDEEIQNDQQKKNNFFDAADYPSAGQILASAGFSWGFEPLPESSGFVGMFDGEAIENDLQKQHDDHLNELFSTAEATNLERLRERIQKSVNILKRYKGEKGQRLQYNGLVEGLNDSAQLALDLNVSNSQAVRDLAVDITNLMGSFEPEELRDDVRTRQRIINELSGMLGDQIEDSSDENSPDCSDYRPEVAPVESNGTVEKSRKDTPSENSLETALEMDF